MIGGMKPLLVLFLALALAALASAADLALKDGRVLRSAVITKQDPTTVTVRHSGGFTQVEKTKLPDELAAQYPVDIASAEAQRAAEMARAEQVTKQQALRAAQIRAAVKTQPAPTPPSLDMTPSRVVRPFLSDADDRWRWRCKPLSAPVSPAYLATRRWEKIYEGRGSKLRTEIDFPAGLWRIVVSYQSNGQSHQPRVQTSVIVSAKDGGDKLACSVNSQTVYGNVAGPATLDAFCQNGGMAVIVEKAVDPL